MLEIDACTLERVYLLREELGVDVAGIRYGAVLGLHSHHVAALLSPAQTLGVSPRRPIPPTVVAASGSVSNWQDLNVSDDSITEQGGGMVSRESRRSTLNC